MRRILYISMLCIVAALVAAGCCRCGSKSRSQASLAGNTWKLVKLMGAQVEADGDLYTLTFTDEGRFNGVGGGNRLMGSYTAAADGKLTIDYPASTRMLCPDQEREDLFFRTVSEADAYEIDGETLMLLHNGEAQALFTLVKADR